MELKAEVIARALHSCSCGNHYLDNFAGHARCDINHQLTALRSRLDKHNVFVITGPTAVGKSAFGVSFASMVDGEIVSADSMQVYKYMNIGTAKPTEDEKCGIAHFMLDIIAPWEDYSVSRYVKDAARCIDDILQRGKNAVIVGGTGLYIDSLLSGRTFSARGNASLRQKLESEYDSIGGGDMLSKLREFDPDSAEKLHPNDKKRIVRAIEVFIASGKPISMHNNETQALPPRYNAMKLALMPSSREALYKRIERRVDIMIANDLESEVRGLLNMGTPPDATSMQAIGYKEIVAAIQGQCSMTDAIEKIKTESRRYSKRQLTWLRRDTSIVWVMQ